MTLFVADAGAHGRGVFTDRAIPRGTTVEIAPVIAIPPSQVNDLSGTALYDYWFAWGEDDHGAALATGFGSLYNHSFAPNAGYRKDLAAGRLEFRAERAIAAGEQVTIDYTGGDATAAPLWFEPRTDVHLVARRADATVVSADEHVGIGPEGGIFAARSFATGETIETAPVILLHTSAWTGIARTVVAPRCFPWRQGDHRAALALGHSALYRESRTPSAAFVVEPGSRTIGFRALRAIAMGEEITIAARAAGPA